jgi:hypothetical protein
MFDSHDVLIRGVSALFLIIPLARQSFDSGIVWYAVDLLLRCVRPLTLSFPVHYVFDRCWIRESEPASRFMLYYVPFLVCFVFIAVCFVLVSQSLHGEPAQRDVNRRLWLYAIVFITIRFWGLVNRGQNVHAPHQPMLGLYFMHSVVSPLGVCSAFVVSFDSVTLVLSRLLLCVVLISFRVS